MQNPLLENVDHYCRYCKTTGSDAEDVKIC